MLNQYEPNVKATITFLQLLNVKVNKATVNETLQNHPDWPSLLCVSDSMNKWNIPNGAGKIDTSEIDQLPTPFMAHTHDREAPLAIVTKLGETTIELFHKNYTKQKNESRENFLKKWNGVYLLAEPNEHSREPNYELKKRKSFTNSIIPVLAFAVFLMVSLFFLTRIIQNQTGSQLQNTTGIYMQYFILFAGVVVTSLLLWYEIDKNNPLLQKVCTGIVKGNCNAILTGKKAKVFEWLSWERNWFLLFYR